MVVFVLYLKFSVLVINVKTPAVNSSMAGAASVPKMRVPEAKRPTDPRRPRLLDLHGLSPAECSTWHAETAVSG